MEIAPIPGIRALPAVKAQHGDLQPPAIFEIDAPAKPGEGGGQRSNGRAAGAEEDGNGEDDQFDDQLLDSEMTSASETPDEVPARQIDYFA